jgi:hypothetical protein
LPESEQRPFTLGWRPVLEAIRASLLNDAERARERVGGALDAYHASPYDHSEGQEGPDADEDAAAAAIYAVQCFQDASVESAAWAAGRMVNIGFAIAEQELGLDAAMIEIVEHDGSRHVETVEVPKGHPRDPLSQAELEAKVRRCADHVIGTSATQELMERVMAIEGKPNLRGVLGRVGQPMPA